MPDAICFFVSQKMDDVFDLFDAIDAIGNQNPQQQANLSVGNDSALPDSIDGFGIDIDNPEANEEYLGENQNPQAIIQGPGVVNENIQLEEKDSGLATSLSGTHVSEFTPVLTEYNLELEPGTDDTENDQNDGNSDQLETNYESALDLAISRGYMQQATTYLVHSSDNLRFRKGVQRYIELIEANSFDEVWLRNNMNGLKMEADAFKKSREFDTMLDIIRQSSIEYLKEWATDLSQHQNEHQI